MTGGFVVSLFFAPDKIYTGAGCINEAGDALTSLGKKALIVTGGHVVRLECFEKLTAILEKGGVEYTVFSGITGEPTDKMIEAGLDVYKSSGCDFIIGIGGGSPLDSMKAIAAMSVNSGKIADYMGRVIGGKLPPMAAIPTTAGTGSEATQFTVITDSENGIKMLLKGDVLLPDIAVIDPEFTISSPKSVTASTGLDALTHAVEAYTSRKAQPLTDAVAADAVRRIFEYLPRAYKDGSDKKAREEMSVAALEAGFAINNSSVTIVHGMSRPIGALFHVPHGLSNAMLLSECMAFACDGAYEKFARLGDITGVSKPSMTEKEKAEAFVAALGEICAVCEVPTLAEYGTDIEAFRRSIDKMSDDALASGSPGNTVKTVTKEDIVRLYEAVLK